MPKRLRPRITFANVVSCLALFIALGSGAYAAKQLPKNSVGTKQLKKNAVTKVKIRKNSVNGPRVKKNSLTGADIKLSKLGTVPSAKSAATASSANTANTANLANSIPPAEPTHLVGTPGEPAFENGSSNFTTPEETIPQPVGFYKDHEGIVHLQGVAQVGAGLPLSKIFTLPPGYRPANNTVLEQIVLCISTPKPCLTDSEGDEQLYTIVAVAGSNVLQNGIPFGGSVVSFGQEFVVSLDTITFRAES